jgi:hypothetical protein
VKDCAAMRILGEGQEECSASMSQWSRSTARPRPAASANRVGIISAREVASTGAASAQTISLGETSAAVLVLSMAVVLAAAMAAAIVKTALSIQEPTIGKENADAEDLY